MPLFTSGSTSGEGGEGCSSGFSRTQNYYTYLNIPSTSTKQELAKIKRNLGLQHHPDRLVSSGGAEASPAAIAEFQKMMETIDALLDDDKRQEHDTRCGINMGMRIDDLLNRGQRLQSNTSSKMDIHTTYPAHGAVVTNSNNKVCSSTFESDEEEYNPTGGGQQQHVESVFANSGKDKALSPFAEHHRGERDRSGTNHNNLIHDRTLFGAQQHTHDDIAALGFKPKRVISTATTSLAGATVAGGGVTSSGCNEEGRDDGCGGGGNRQEYDLSAPSLPTRGGLLASSSSPSTYLPRPPSLTHIGLNNDPALENVKAFESVGLKRERSPHIARKQERCPSLAEASPTTSSSGHCHQQGVVEIEFDALV